METEPIEPEPGGPLTADHYHELSLAKDRARPIRRASRVAAFNGWTIGAIAVLSMPFAFFGLDGLLVTIGLFIVSYLEFRGRNELQRFIPSAASLLGWNQIGFLGLIIAYCLWMLFGGAEDIRANPQISQLLGADGIKLYQSIVLLLYGTVIVLSVIFQGGNAIYYFTRRKHIDAYVEQTPQWVRDFQLATKNL